MAQKSIFTEVTQELRAEIRALRETKRDAVPFMKERVDDSVARKQFFSLPPEGRKRMAAKMPREDLLRLLRGS